MIDTFQAKTTRKILFIQNKGFQTFIGEPQGKGKKPKLIDIAFGDFNAIVNDLTKQGFNLKIIN